MSGLSPSLPGSLQALFQPYCPEKPRMHQPTGNRKIVQLLLLAQGNRCALCGETMSLHRSCVSHRAATVDHVTPRAHGGKSSGNRFLTHRRCNERKADRMPRACELLLLEAVNLNLATPPSSLSSNERRV